MPDQLKILFITSESTPYAKTGGLADVSGALSRTLSAGGLDIRVIMPFYKCIADRGYKLKHTGLFRLHSSLGMGDEANIFQHEHNGLITYFVDNKKYFDRDELYGTAGSDYTDSAYRFGFLSKAALSLIKALDFRCDIIHCNDWQCGLVPNYLSHILHNEAFYKDIKTLFTIHNLAYQGIFPGGALGWLGIPRRYFNMRVLDFNKKINFLESGIRYSHAINTVSKKYAEEILTGEYGCGLDRILNARRKDLCGITNGVDYTDWNPETDTFIKHQYSSNEMEGKMTCKKDLLNHVGLELPLDRPCLGVVSRLAWQKGVDLISALIKHLPELDAGLVILGKGDERYQKALQEQARGGQKRARVIIKFDEELAHKIEAGSDIFLMPSRYEPCGLNQMYSLKYGTIPVVRATGGLDDVITDYDENSGRGNGFKFDKADVGSFLKAVRRAVTYYRDKVVWDKLMRKAMSEDYSWCKSAEAYITLYKNILNRNTGND